METIEIDQTYLRMDTQGFYKLDIPEKLNMARLMVNFRASHGRAQDVAIYDENRKITYKELKDLTDRCAKGGR